MDEHPTADRPGTPSKARTESDAWSLISTLVAGPATWGGIGWLVDRWLDTSPWCTVLGIIIGAVTSFYIVIKRTGQ